MASLNSGLDSFSTEILFDIVQLLPQDALWNLSWLNRLFHRLCTVLIYNSISHSHFLSDQEDGAGRTSTVLQSNFNCKSREAC